MSNLIDKAKVIEEIKRQIDIDTKYGSNVYDCCNDVLSFINTLEVQEVNLENSMVCKVDWFDGFFLDYTQEQQDTLLEKIGATYGDKIRVILIKE